MIHVELIWNALIHGSTTEREEGVYVARVRTDDFHAALMATLSGLAAETAGRTVELDRIHMAVDHVPEIDP